MNFNIEGLLHGGDYNPEQWLDDPGILEKDIEYMKEAKINTVTLGVFSWAVLEPEEGVFHFQWMEDIIDRLYEDGISVILATPSGARPKWMADKYPEVLRVDGNRQRNLFGGRHNHCYTSPVYREKVSIMNQELGKRFGAHPGVILWHLSNEYGGDCHCPLCQEAFRNWLREKYKTIDELNRRWSTTFWSHIYQNFDQVESPSPRGEMQLHGLNLDWKRFVTHQTIDFIKAEAAAIRQTGSKIPTTVNCMYYYNELDYAKFNDVVDVLSWDSYPTWHKEDESVTAMDTAMMHDLLRCVQKKPFLLMESCPSATNWQKVSKLKKPGMHQLSSLQAVAHGSDSVLYFQIRQSRGASEKFHGAVIDHYGGNDTRVFREVTDVGYTLEEIKETCSTDTVSEAAVIYDWENKWAMEDAQGPRNQGLYYKETVQKYYRALREQGINVDVIGSGQDLEGYKVVAAPMLYLYREDFADKVRRFVEKGGHFIMTFWSGIVDETDRCYLGGTPYGLMDVLGLRSMEIDGLYDHETNRIQITGQKETLGEGTYECGHLCDLVKVSTAEVLAVYEQDFYKGYPALTCNQFGKGKAYYVCTDAEQDFCSELCRHIGDDVKLTKYMGKVPKGIEVTARNSDTSVYLFVQNYNSESVKLELPDGFAVLAGNWEADGGIGPFGTVVLKDDVE